MKRIITIALALLLFAVPVYSDSLASDVCTLTFTNITTTSQVATSCTGKCKNNANCAIEMVRGETIQVDWIPSSYLHTATDWDVEVWVSDEKLGPYKRYTDALTNGDALATLGGDAATRYDVSLCTAAAAPVAECTKANYVVYKFDGTGVDPAITATDPAPGSVIATSGFATANNGVFIVEVAGTDYFEVYNASGATEANIVPGLNGITFNANATSLTGGSVGITTGSNYSQIKVSENASVAVYGTVIATVRR